MQQEAMALKLEPILVCGDESLTEDFIKIWSQKIDKSFLLTCSYSEISDVLNSSNFPLIILCCRSNEAELKELASLMRSRHPRTPVILISDNFSSKIILDGINNGPLFKFLKWPLSLDEILKHVQEAAERSSLYRSRTFLLKESSSYNRELEALTHSLEEIVEERTKHIQESNNEQTEKLNKERNLIRFISDLSAQNSFEEILQIVRRELKRFHHLGEPILVYRDGGIKTKFWSFHSGAMRFSEGSIAIDFPKKLMTQETSILKHFANHFGRPFAKAVFLPLDVKMMKLHALNAEAFICFENSLSESDLQQFVEFLNERQEALQMVVDRVLLEEFFETFSWRWEKTFDGLRDPIAIIDTEFSVIRSNSKFSERLNGKKCFEVFAQRNSPCENCPALNENRGESGINSTVGIRDRVYQVHAYPIKSAGGFSTSFVHQYVDVTQSRELYLKMLQSEKMGAIGMLAGNIAHELNNPLTGLKSLAQVLISESSEEKQLNSDLIEIEKAAERSQKIIKNLLDFSRGDVGIVENTDLDELVKNTMPMLKTALRMHRFHLQLSGKNVFVKVEPHLIQQVVFNLVNNACQAMKDIGDLTVRTGYLHDKAFIEIEDNGPGIPLEIQSKIFEPFFTTKQEGQGTGLGLSLAKSLIEKFSGSLSLKNVDPHGACFRIELPVVPSTEALAK